MKVYYHPNLDGTRQALVAARDQIQACRIMGCSVQDFHKYRGRVVKGGAAYELAIARPFVGLFKKIDGVEKWAPLQSALPPSKEVVS